jgi:hypothetical protein
MEEPRCLRPAVGGSQGQLEPAGEGQAECAVGGVPALHDRPFNQLGWGFARDTFGEPGFLGAFPGSFVLDVANGQPQQLDHRVVVGEVAAVLDDLPQLVVQRLDAVGIGYERPRGSACCSAGSASSAGHTV